MTDSEKKAGIAAFLYIAGWCIARAKKRPANIINLTFKAVAREALAQAALLDSAPT